MNANTFKMTLAVLVSAGLLGAGIALFHEATPGGTLPVAIAREVDKDAPAKKDPPAKPDQENERSANSAKCRDAAIEWLKKNHREDGTWENTGLSLALPGGTTSVVVLALLDSGVKTNDAALVRALKYLRELKPSMTYTVALQTVALSRVNDKKDAAIIADNVDWLVAAALFPNANDLRGWSYGKANATQADFSNTQFALFALYEAGRAGFKPKNKKFWESVRAMYLGAQHVDGGWGYRPDAGASTFSMTCAGLCGLFLADDDIGNESADTRKAKKNASIFLARSYRPFDGISAFYNLDLIARLGRLSGESKIGEHEWYREGVDWILKNQNADGSIAGTSAVDKLKPLATAYGILFLNADPGKN